MTRSFVSLVSGLFFGLGLAISQMINPAKVLGFLDVLGDWDPSLALVMAGAIPVTAIGYRFAGRRATPLCSPAFADVAQRKIDCRLVSGAILFGIGWGLVGYCPGPALASIGLGNSATFLFVVAMVVGMLGFNGFQLLMGHRSVNQDRRYRLDPGLTE